MLGLVEEDGVVKALFEKGAAFGGNLFGNGALEGGKLLFGGFAGFFVGGSFGSVDRRAHPGGLAINLRLVFGFGFGAGGGFEAVEFSLLPGGEFLQEENGGFDAGAGAHEGVLAG